MQSLRHNKGAIRIRSQPFAVRLGKFHKSVTSFTKQIASCDYSDLDWLRKPWCWSTIFEDKSSIYRSVLFQTEIPDIFA